VHKHIERYAFHYDEKMQILKLIYQIREDHPTMGVRDMYFKLQPEYMGRDIFENFCRENNLMSRKEKNYKRTTDSSGVEHFKNLLKGREITAIDQVWQSDITYFEIRNKFYYITFILDNYSRRILGYHTSTRLFTEHTTLPALHMAIKTRGKNYFDGLIIHSDGGGQYYDKEFLDLTTSKRMLNSMCEFAWENGKAERINGVIKNNYLKHWNIQSFKELELKVDRAVHLYNNDKPHKELKKMSPVLFENRLLNLQKQTSR
jgi:putative transposase